MSDRDVDHKTACDLARESAADKLMVLRTDAEDLRLSAIKATLDAACEAIARYHGCDVEYCEYALHLRSIDPEAVLKEIGK